MSDAVIGDAVIGDAVIGDAVRSAARSSIRPAGLAPGTVVLAGAWIVAGAIARLTGAPAVIAIMAGLVVALAADAVAGRSRLRRVEVAEVAAPDVTTVGIESIVTLVWAAHGDPRRGGRETSVAVAPAGRHPVGTTILPSATDPERGTTVVVRFTEPGVVDELVVTVDVGGPLGLTRWRRRSRVTVDGIHVAPIGVGPMVDVERSASALDGAAATDRGNHAGEVDGVRPWREGDPVGAVHWPSSLRAGDLIVHDRTTTSDQVWTVDLDGAGLVTPARLRWTLDEGRHLGHTVTVVTDGVRHPVRSADDSARWAARSAQGVEPPPWGTGRPPQRRFWQRDLRAGASEPSVVVRPAARWAAAAAAFAALAMLVGALDWTLVLTVVVAAGLALGGVVSLALARRSGRRPIAMRVAMVAVIGVALAAIAVDAREVNGLLAVLRGPMPDLLILLVVLHGFEVVDRRTLRVHQAITVVVAAYAAGLRIDSALGWWLAAWATSFLASLAMTTRSVPAGSWRSRRGGAAAIGAPPPTAIWRPVAWAIGSIAATLALLSVVPIPDGPARLGLPALSNGAPTVGSPGSLAGPDGNPAAPTTERRGEGSLGNLAGYPGFSTTLDTSVRGDLGDDVVMRVRAPEPAFWRGQTFTDFDGRVWTAPDEPGRRLEGPVIDIPPSLGDPTRAMTKELVQTFYLETDLPNLVFAASRPDQVIFDGSLYVRPDGALLSDVTLTDGSVYTVVSQRVQVTAGALRAQGDLGDVFGRFRDAPGGEVLDPFLELPDSTSQRTIDLAASLKAPGASTYDTIRAYERWLGENTQYDLDAPVPPEGTDAVDDFLFESRLGYCEQIASALTVMLRSQGVPARLATGYVAGERDRVSGVWEVRASDAHAWVEVWFPQTGWQPFDPTANVPLSGEAATGTVGGDLTGAALSTLAAHRSSLAIGALVAISVWAVAHAARRARHRRARGRWGLLQDRYTALDSCGPVTGGTGDPAPTFTNPALAARLDGAGDRPGDSPHLTAHAVATVLDRVAFDPSFADDDDVYRRTSAAISLLERAHR